MRDPRLVAKRLLRPVHCTVCGRKAAQFAPTGKRVNALCRCGALERHRALWLLLRARTRMFDGGVARMLHVAPEPFLRQRFVELVDRYVSVDLHHREPEAYADITRLPFADATFDFVLCLHVFEHVPDDAAAMRELARVLRPDGRLVVQVPMNRGSELTIEDLDADEETRLRRFGQDDHLRLYGLDLFDRLAAAGLRVEDVRADELTDRPERYGLRPELALQLCTRAT